MVTKGKDNRFGDDGGCRLLLLSIFFFPPESPVRTAQAPQEAEPPAHRVVPTTGKKSKSHRRTSSVPVRWPQQQQQPQ